MHWWPRQTPRIGSCAGELPITSSEMPASFGVHGPGEMTMRSGSSALDLVDVDLVVAHDLHVRPSSPKYWTRL